MAIGGHILTVSFTGEGAAPAYVGDYDYNSDYNGHPKFKQYVTSNQWFVEWLAIKDNQVAADGWYITDTEDTAPAASANGGNKVIDPWLSIGNYQLTSTNWAKVTAYDPLTELFIALWDLLDASGPLAALVPYRNRQHLFAGKFGLEKQKRSSADFPEVSIEPSGGGYNPADTNTTVMMAQSFTVRLSGENKRGWPDFFPLKYTLARALSNIDFFNGRPMTYGNVTRARISDHSDTTGDISPKGWSAEMTINFEIRFDRSTFKGT